LTPSRYSAIFITVLVSAIAFSIIAMLELSRSSLALLGMLALSIALVVSLHHLFFYPLSACLYIHNGLYTLEVRTPVAIVVARCSRIDVGDITVATTPIVGIKLGRRVLGLFNYVGGGRVLCFGAYAVGIVGHVLDERYAIYLSCRGLESLVNCLKSGECRFACTV